MTGASMTTISRITIILLILAASALSATAAEITAHCVSDGTVAIRARFWADELVEDWLGVVVERSQVGLCGGAVVLTEEPLHLLDGYDMGDHLLSYPVPSATVSYRYALKGSTPQGGLVDMTGSQEAPTWFAVESCSGDALVLRGRLRDIGAFGRLGIEVCEGYCWDICPGEPTVGVVTLDPAEYEPYVGTNTVVSVYGAWDASPPEFSWGCVVATRIETGVDCAGAVASEPSSWGAVKSRYR